MDAIDRMFAKIHDQVNEFESFVDRYSSEMDRILQGDFTKEENKIMKKNVSDDEQNEEQETTKEDDDSSRPPVKVPPPSHQCQEATPTHQPIESKATKSAQEPNSILKKHVTDLKSKGNNAFTQHRYHDAITFYTDAIHSYSNPASILDSNPHLKSDDPLHFITETHLRLSKPVVDPALYTNRALCYLKLRDWVLAMEDCSKSLEIDPNNMKALWRRQQAYRMVQSWNEAKCDLARVKDLMNSTALEKPVNIKPEYLDQLIQNVDSCIKIQEKDTTIRNKLQKDASLPFVESLVKVVSEEIEGKSSIQTSEQQLNSRTVLEKLLLSHADGSDAFRVAGGLQLSMDICDRSLIHDKVSTVDVEALVNLIESSTRNNVDNLRILCTSRISSLVDLIVRSKEGIVSLIKLFTNMLKHGLGFDLTPNNLLSDTNLKVLIEWVTKQQTRTEDLYLFFNFLQLLLKTGYELSETQEWSRVIGLIPNLFKEHLPLCLNIVNHLIRTNVNLITPHISSLTTGLFGQYVNSKSVDTLTTIYNLLVKAESSVSFNQEFVECVMEFDTENTLQIPVLSKLIRHHSNRVIDMIAQRWKPMVPKMIAFVGTIVTQDKLPTVNAVCQIVALVLQLSPNKQALLKLFNTEGGYASLCTALCNLNRLLSTVNNKIVEVGDMVGNDTEWVRSKRQAVETCVGNVGLAIGECVVADREGECITNSETIQSIINLLKLIQEKKVQRNLGIALSRMCKNDKTLELVRKYKGIEVLYQLGPGILQK